MCTQFQQPKSDGPVQDTVSASTLPDHTIFVQLYLFVHFGISELMKLAADVGNLVNLKHWRCDSYTRETCVPRLSRP